MHHLFPIVSSNGSQNGGLKFQKNPPITVLGGFRTALSSARSSALFGIKRACTVTQFTQGRACR
jgi:hypothetical protein